MAGILLFLSFQVSAERVLERAITSDARPFDLAINLMQLSRWEDRTNTSPPFGHHERQHRRGRPEQPGTASRLHQWRAMRR